MELGAIIPGVLTGFAALIAALAAIIKKSNSVAAEEKRESTKVMNDSVDVIEKIVDGQTQVNKMLMDRLHQQDALIADLQDVIDELKKVAKEREERSG